MANQNCRAGELEICVEAPEMAEATNQFGNLQFLVVRDFEELDLSKKRTLRRPAKARLRTVRTCNVNDSKFDSVRRVCNKSNVCIREYKNIEGTAVYRSRYPTIKDSLSEDCDNSQYSQVSLSTAVGDSSEESCLTFRDSRQPCFRRASRTTVQSGQTEEAEQKHTTYKREDSGDVPENSKEGAAFSVECFAQLYKRIEALEELLQQGLDSFKKETCNCKEKNKNRPLNKVKFGAEKKSKPRLGGGPGTSEIRVVNEEKENRDTDTEIRDIKKRVVALEEKLKRITISNTQSNLNVRSPSKPAVVLQKVKQKRSNCHGTNEKQSDSTGQTHSEGDSFQQSQVMLLNPEVNELFDWKGKNKVKKKSLTMYKKIRGKCSSVSTTSKKSSHSRNDSGTACNYLSEYSAQGLRSFDSALCDYPLTNKPVSDKNQMATAVVYLNCHHASVAWRSKQTKKKPTKSKLLCRKNPVTNFIMASFTDQENEIDDPRAFGDCKLPTSRRKCRHSKRKSKECGRSRNPPTGAHSSHRRHTRWTVSKRRSRPYPVAEAFSRRKSKIREKEVKKDNCLSKGRSGTPEGDEKGGGKMKIPVLFKEFCKPMKPVQKISNISMRFVVVENDPKNSLRKLLEKLSKGQPQDKSEQYVFGVSKCSCNEVPGSHYYTLCYRVCYNLNQVSSNLV